MEILTAFLGIILLVDRLIWQAISRAPRGFEDDQGFHVLRRDK